MMITERSKSVIPFRPNDAKSVGEGCVIGAGSVVAKDVADYSIAVGNPARALRDRREARA